MDVAALVRSIVTGVLVFFVDVVIISLFLSPIATSATSAVMATTKPTNAPMQAPTTDELSLYPTKPPMPSSGTLHEVLINNVGI